MNVYITVDTEIWPMTPDWRDTGLRDDFLRDIEGRTRHGEFGLRFQSDMLNAHGLKATFFVEALHSCVVGGDLLARIVNDLQAGGQDIQLHVHPDWLAHCTHDGLPRMRGNYMRNYPQADQERLLQLGRELLEGAGARAICAFRAGHYGANLDTLRALFRTGFRYDSSYNLPYLGTACGIETDNVLLQPRMLEGVTEFPIAFVRDLPRHRRHVQLCALSSSEIEAALLKARDMGWKHFVIVSHSFELLNRGELRGRPVLPDRIVIRRLERLCRFLSQNRESFMTATFGDLDWRQKLVHVPGREISTGMGRTTLRMMEQALRRLR